MIDNTKTSGNSVTSVQQEIDNARNRRVSFSQNGSTSQDTIRTSNRLDEQNKHDDNRTGEEARRFYDTNGNVEHDNRSREGSDSRDSTDGGQARGSDNSTNQYSQRFTTASRPTTGVKSKFSFFQPYQQAIKDFHKERAKEEKNEHKRPEPKVFTQAEAQLKRDELIDTLLWTSEHADQVIIATTKGHDKTIIIWSDIDHDEAGILADVLLDLAKTDKRVAGAIRSAMEVKRKAKAGIILVPRAYRTAMIYLERGFSIR